MANYDSMTHPQCLSRLRDLETAMSEVANIDRPSKSDEALFDQLDGEFRAVNFQREKLERRAKVGAGSYRVEAGVGGDYSTPARSYGRRGASVVLRSDETVSDNLMRRGAMDAPTADLSFDRFIRAVGTGDWRGAREEQRAIAETPLSAGGYLVPTPVAADVIDRARNTAQVVTAGASVVPMTSATLRVPRLLTEPVPQWRNEAAAINDAAMTFDQVTLTAQSLAVMVKVSWELLEDAQPESRVLSDSFAKAFALEIDRVCLRGSGTAPEPRGIRNQTGITVTTFGANGTTPVDYGFLLDAIQVLRAGNYEPNAALMAPRTATTLAKLRDGGSTGGYLAPPAALANFPLLLTNQLPTNGTTGTSTDTSDVFVGDFSKLLLGVRTDLRIRLLEERFADFGQVAFVADLRMDVQLAQPSAFVVVSGVRP